MSTTVHYPPKWAAGGGLIDCTAATMALLFHDNMWKIVNSEGQVFAESDNPGDLAGWLNDYAAELGHMHDNGEL